MGKQGTIRCPRLSTNNSEYLCRIMSWGQFLCNQVGDKNRRRDGRGGDSSKYRRSYAEKIDEAL